jgi:hypothetical protein
MSERWDPETDRFLDRLAAIGYEPIHRTELAALRAAAVDGSPSRCGNCGGELVTRCADCNTLHGDRYQPEPVGEQEDDQ